jgi:hypothetical protein
MTAAIVKILGEAACVQGSAVLFEAVSNRFAGRILSRGAQRQALLLSPQSAIAAFPVDGFSYVALIYSCRHLYLASISIVRETKRSSIATPRRTTCQCTAISAE